MKNRAKKLITPLLTFLMSFVVLCPGTGNAFEQWNGEVTGNVKLRISPGIDSRVITCLRKGEKILVKDKHNDWYNIVHETDAYGYRGWVYGKFVEKIENDEEKPRTPINKSAEVAEIPKEASRAEVASEGKQGAQELDLSAKSQKNVPQDTSHEEVKPLVEKKAQDQEIEALKQEIDKIAQGTEAAQASDVSFVVKQDRGGPFPIVRETERQKSPKVTNRENYPDQQRISVLIRLILRLSPVVLSLLALLFSYNALKLSRQN